MFCTKCGSRIEDGSLYCTKCGEEVQLVPDFTDLGEFLMDEKLKEEKRLRESEERKEIEKQRRKKDEEQRQEEQRRREEERKRREKERQKKKTRKMIIYSAIISILIILALGLVIITGINKKKSSFDYQMNQAKEAFDDKNLERSLEYVDKALKIKADPDAFLLKSEILIYKKDTKNAITVLKELLVKDPANEKGYKRLIGIYETEENPDAIKELLDECKNENILAAFKDYIVEDVVFSIPSGVYKTTRKLQLIQGNADIYYTTDGTDPTEESKKYTTPFKIPNGEITVKAIAVNEKGIKSNIVKETYEVDAPGPESPSVSPSSGTFYQYTAITVIVPDGCTAYYEMNGTPTQDSKVYEEPVWMWDGNNVFNVMLVDEDGQESEITSQTYNLVVEKKVEPETETPAAETTAPEEVPTDESAE